MIFIASVALSTALPEPASAQSAAWSEIVDGIQGRLWVSKSGRTFNETEMTDVYLELRNVSGGLTPVEIYYDTEHSIWSCEVVDSEGHPILGTGDRAFSVASILMPSPFWLTLPRGGLLQFIVSISGHGVPKRGGIMVEMPCGVWGFKSDGQSPFLRATMKVEPRQEAGGHRAWHGTLSLPPAPIPIE
jgi:hypothetical protein